MSKSHFNPTVTPANAERLGTTVALAETEANITAHGFPSLEAYEDFILEVLHRSARDHEGVEYRESALAFSAGTCAAWHL